MAEKPKIKRRLSSFQIIILGFAAVILIGALVLMLPISSQGGQVTPFSDALFTSTSAVCVTGLIVFDTATYWSYFGQAVILVLIQIGGLGVVTVATTIALLSGRKIGLMQRSTMQESISAQKVGGIVRLTRFILITTFSAELLAAAVMAPVFIKDFGLKGIWMAIFHSISAFCNAGFDLMGQTAQFSSLTAYAAQPIINITVILLILFGGIGFLTWDDFFTHKFHFSRYRMQSKLVLSASAILILLPALFFFFFEFSSLPLGERILASLFQTVTPRTAGFNTVDLNSLSQAAQTIMIILMLIGGSSGSTAGGMKITTVGVLFSSAFSIFRRKDSAHVFGRRISDSTVRHAAAIAVMYLSLLLGGTIVISVIEGLPILTCLYETASAVATVGLTLGVTPSLSTASHLILIALMFLGRVGGLTLIYAAFSGPRHNVSKLPQEKITVG
ncbi:MAG: Trk family potassium uptake protein [Ruminococcaceae bacterium]|nr:Trk family potassium uptake protein [Oscillospiraceae bacterium]